MGPEFFLAIGGALKWAGLAALPFFLLPLLTTALPGPFERPARTLAGWIDKATGFAMGGAVLAALVLVIAQLFVVFLRFVYGMAFTWLNEIVIYAFAAMFMLGASAALRDDAHVRVDILRPRFGETGRGWIELIGCYLFLFPICVRILDAGEQGLTQSWRLFEGSRETDGLPALFLFKTLLPVFAVLMMIQGLSVALKAALIITGRMNEAEAAKPSGGAHGA